MAKKGWGKLVALAAVSGAVAAGVSYVLQYKTYHKELEKDFREFEEDEDSELKKDGSEDSTFESAKVNRNYISLTSSKDEFKVAAKDMAQATKMCSGTQEACSLIRPMRLYLPLWTPHI